MKALRTGPWVPVGLLLGAITVFAVWPRHDHKETRVNPPPNLGPDTVSSNPIITRSPNASPFVANFYFLFDVSASTNTPGAHNTLQQGVPIFRRAFYKMRDMDEVLPARFRVGTIGTLSLSQSPVCDIPVEPPSVFLKSDTTRVARAVDGCQAALLHAPADAYTDIKGALSFAAMSVHGFSPGLRGIVLVSDLEEDLPPNQVPANPNLSGICVAVYSQVTRENAANPVKLDSLQRVWTKYITARGASKVTVISVLGFDADDLVAFFRDCEHK